MEAASVTVTRGGAIRLAPSRSTRLTTAELDSVLAQLTPTFKPVVAPCTFAARISEALGLR
jgi:hypothetical protein